jgi:hypothetical protein
MCRNCGTTAPSCRTTTALTWAVPVDIVKLGASLEAYLTLKPRITALRLCNKLGRGPDVFVNSLPLELINMIIAYLLVPEQRCQEVKWRTIQSCSENRCIPSDHASGGDFDDLRHTACEVAEDEYEGDSESDGEGLCDLVDDIFEQLVRSAQDDLNTLFY